MERRLIMDIYLKLPLALFFCFLSLAQATPVRASFLDTNLMELLKTSGQKGEGGLIYIWSPRMPLSILGVEELTVVARKLKLPLTVVVDPTSIETEIARASKENYILKNSFRMDSAVLTSMNIKIHYPSLVIYKNGQLLSPSRPGYDEPDRVEDYLVRRLK
jgi:hypothetical protein